MELSDRKQKILAAAVELYIQTGDPVGSKAVCAKLEFPVSSATVRNEMSELGELGLLEQPHTSAGRVPSQKAYRFYIDRLMKRKSLAADERRALDGLLLSSAYDPQRLLDGVSKTLAAMTRLAAVSTTPSGSGAVIRAVQFVQTSRRTAMVILMTSAGTMKNRVFHCDFDLTPEILRMFFRIINERLAGMRVNDVTPAFVQSMAAQMGDMAMLISSALMAVLEVAQESTQADICMDGATNLLFYPEFSDGGARRVMDFLERPQELGRLLMQQPNAVKVLVGRETDRPELSNSSVIVSRYCVGGRDAGAIAVIGPTRMDYARLIAGIEYLSQSVGRMLTELMDNE